MRAIGSKVGLIMDAFHEAQIAERSEGESGTRTTGVLRTSNKVQGPKRRGRPARKDLGHTSDDGCEDCIKKIWSKTSERQRDFQNPILMRFMRVESTGFY